MSAKSPADVRGLEFDWLASDAQGNVALFSTAGGGYAPNGFLSDTDAHDRAIRDLLAAPESTKAQFAPQLAENYINTWRMAAERGVFAFDSDPNGGPYSLVAAPESAARISDLPESVRSVVRGLVLPALVFGSARTIEVDLLK